MSQAIIGTTPSPIISFRPRNITYVTIKFAGACYWGGRDVSADHGVDAVAGEVVTFTHQDFPANRIDELIEIWGIATVATTARVGMASL